MELTPAFKQTDVGVIPTEWNNPPIAELIDPNAPICYGVVQVGRNTPDGVPIVAIKYLKNIAMSPLHRTDPTVERPYARSRIQGFDVLLSIKGTVGRVGVVPFGFKGNISRELARLRPKDGVEPNYVAYQLESDRTQARIARAIVGTTRQEFSIGVLREFTIPVPNLRSEQRAIAEALSDMDGLLGGLDRLIAKNRDLKQAAVQQLLTGQTRLPGFADRWEVKELGSIALIMKGTQLQSAESSIGGRYPHFNGGISPSGYTDRSNAPANTIAISEGGNSCGYVQLVHECFWCGGHCYAVVPRDVHNECLYHLLKAQQLAIMKLRVGSGLPNVQKTALASFPLSFPTDPDEQSAIATVLSDMDAELAALEARRDKTRALKQAMMQELLTGRIRLVEPEAAAA